MTVSSPGGAVVALQEATLPPAGRGDNTDLGDLAAGELSPEAVTLAETPTVTISVRSACADVARLRALATKMSQGSTTLARSWILERLAEEESGEDDPRAMF